MVNSTKKSINTWAEEDRPREKLILKGKKALSDAEIIAILIGSGSRNQSAVELSRDILAHYNNDLNSLAKASVNELLSFRGIGEAKAISIVSALELGRRRKNESSTKKPILSNSNSVYEYLKHIFLDLQHEEFWAILLDKSLKPIRSVQIGQGGVSAVVADPKMIFKAAIENLSSGIIICHNHPSGKLAPSDADLQLTKKIKKAADFLDISLHDHLIFTNESFFSFSDNGLL